MSDQSKDRNDETQNNKKPQEQQSKQTKPAPASDQAKQQRAKPVAASAQAGQQTKKKREKRIMVIMIVLAVIMLIAMALVLLYRRWVKKPELPPVPGQTSDVTESKAPNDPNASNEPSAEPSEDPTLDFDAVQPLVGGKRRSEEIYTFLVFGSDTTSGLTDTIMVGTYDITNQKATVMSIPRDTLVNVRNSYKNINGVYKQNGRGERGTAALKKEVSELVGFVPDYYVMIDWELVGEMVDAIGGVWFDNPYHLEYYDPYQDLNIYQEAGYRKLNGNDAMQVVRWRKNNDGVSTGSREGDAGSDLIRLQLQHEFLKAVLKQTLQIKNVFRIGKLAELFGNRVESDLSVENIFWFAQEAILGGLQTEDVNFCTMPIVGVYQGRFKNRVYPNQNALLKLINESLNPFVEKVTIRQLDLIRASADGDTLSSSTGVLADPSAAIPPVRETDPPEESDPLESGEPMESGEPIESEEPTESREPQESGAPAESGQPVHSDPPESEPPAPPPATEPPEPSLGPDEGSTGDEGTP